MAVDSPAVYTPHVLLHIVAPCCPLDNSHAFYFAFSFFSTTKFALVLDYHSWIFWRNVFKAMFQHIPHSLLFLAKLGRLLRVCWRTWGNPRLKPARTSWASPTKRTASSCRQETHGKTTSCKQLKLWNQHEKLKETWRSKQVETCRLTWWNM